MSTTKVTKGTLATRVRELIAGTQLHSPNGQLTLGGQTFTAQTLVQTLTILADALSKVDAAKASWKGALNDLADAKVKVGPIMKAYRSWIVATYGNAPPALADFGVAPPKAHTPLTADQTAKAVAKRKATRALRHTLGPKQKKDIKATMPSTATTPAAPGPKPGS